MESPEFLSESYVRAWLPYARSPFEEGEALAAVRRVLAICAGREEAATVLSALYADAFVAEPGRATRGWDGRPWFGEDAGAAVLLVALGAASRIKAAHSRLGLDAHYCHDLLKWIGGMMAVYKAGHGGAVGFPVEQLESLRLPADGRLFRLGRLEFLMHRPPAWVPPLYRLADGALSALCPEGWRLTAAGLRAAKEAPSSAVALTTTLTEDGPFLTGTPLLGDGTAAVGETRRIDRRTARAVYAAWDLVPSVHIPGGEPLDLPQVRASFAEAREFFRRVFHREVPLFVCWSWLLNPSWQRLLPQSRIARFGRAFFRFPGLPNHGTDGMFFVYGHERRPPTELPARNTMERAMRQAYLEEGELRTGAMLLPADDIPRLPGAAEEWR